MRLPHPQSLSQRESGVKELEKEKRGKKKKGEYGSQRRLKEYREGLPATGAHVV
jgi:hypothetical protein